MIKHCISTLGTIQFYSTQRACVNKFYDKSHAEKAEFSETSKVTCPGAKSHVQMFWNVTDCSSEM